LPHLSPALWDLSTHALKVFVFGMLEGLWIDNSQAASLDEHVVIKMRSLTNRKTKVNCWQAARLGCEPLFASV